MNCTICRKNNQVVAITTYKRKWNLCNECGCAFSQERKCYPLSFLPHQNLKKQKFESEDNIYDYFLSEAHKEVSLSDFKDFTNNFSSFLENTEHKNILDVSGGSGRFLENFKSNKNYVLLTELNAKAVQHAQNKHGVNAVCFDFNKDGISDVLEHKQVTKKFDYVFLRACSMFCLDFKKFLTEIKKHLNQNAIVIVHRNVLPTVGVMVRTQFDDYSYLILRQQKILQQSFDDSYKLLKSAVCEDIYTRYVVAHDVGFINSLLKNFYSIKAVNKIKKYFSTENFPTFRLRDRHLYYLVYQFSE